jgi:hypothetical protein
MNSDTPKDTYIKQTEYKAQDYSSETLADVPTLCTMFLLISIHIIQSSMAEVRQNCYVDWLSTAHSRVAVTKICSAVTAGYADLFLI